LEDCAFQYARIAVVGGTGTGGPLLVPGVSVSISPMAGTGGSLGSAEGRVGSLEGRSGSFWNFAWAARRVACNWTRDLRSR
jgi:hypothetical protein